MALKTIISASRRTDLPAFYCDWLIKQFEQSFVDVPNPVNKKLYKVSLENVHSVVLWSKNFGPLIKRIDAFRNYQLFFMFTLNTPSPLEPNLPPLEKRFEQLDYLANQFGAERLFIRFDPIVHWTNATEVKNNLSSFEKILDKVSGLGIVKVKTSFMDTSYRKLANRGFSFVDLALDEKKVLAIDLATAAKRYGIKLQFCCNQYLFEKDTYENMEPACCIDGRLISQIVGEPAVLKKDPSQRAQCQCTQSRDIGDYAQACFHGCRYCYANPHIE